MAGWQVPGKQAGTYGWQVPMAGWQVAMAGWQVPMAGWQVPMAGWQVPMAIVTFSTHTHCPQMLRAKHLWTSARVAASVLLLCFALLCFA